MRNGVHCAEQGTLWSVGYAVVRRVHCAEDTVL